LNKGILIIRRLTGKKEYYYGKIDPGAARKIVIIEILKTLHNCVFPIGFKLRYEPSEDMKFFGLNKGAIKAIFERC